MFVSVPYPVYTGRVWAFGLAKTQKEQHDVRICVCVRVCVWVRVLAVHLVHDRNLLLLCLLLLKRCDGSPYGQKVRIAAHPTKQTNRDLQNRGI